MKITFEGTYGDIVEQMQHMLTRLTGPKIIRDDMSEKQKTTAIPTNGVQGPGPEPEVVAAPVDKGMDKSVESVAARLKAGKEKKAAERAAAKAAAEAAAGEEKWAKPMPAPDPLAEPAKKAPSPAELVAIRQKTIDELQAAYANGKQQEVFELLSRFGDGAKSFRELKPEAFVPIREAIDLGALT